MSLAYQMPNDLPMVRMGAMLPYINALPGSQQQATVRKRNTQMHGCQSRPDMGWHVIGPLKGVVVNGVTIGS
jgi:hypothetical protein